MTRHFLYCFTDKRLVMLIKEYRIVLPITVDEYKIGQLFTTMQMSKENTGGGEGVTIIKNEPFGPDDIQRPFRDRFDRGQFTHKHYDFESRVPRFIRILIPKGATKIDEKAWNCYPYCYTKVTNPEFMKEHFYIEIETIHLPDDRGDTHNALGLPPEQLQNREVKVIRLDINDDQNLSKQDLNEYRKKGTHPNNFESKETGRGPLVNHWQDIVTPVMCCYKVVTCHFKWRGLQNQVERYIQSNYPRLFTKFHRDLWLAIDQWHALTMDQIRQIEREAKQLLDEQKKKGAKKGMKCETPR